MCETQNQRLTDVALQILPSPVVASEFFRSLLGRGIADSHLWWVNTTLYLSDLSNEEWLVLEPLLETPKRAGRPPVHDLRRMVNAIFYLLRTGVQWRMMPREYPPWGSVYDHYAQWRDTGTWERINTALRERHRHATGRAPQPSAAIIDSH